VQKLVFLWTEAGEMSGCSCSQRLTFATGRL
jgi:hypothetical protein